MAKDLTKLPVEEKELADAIVNQSVIECGKQFVNADKVLSLIADASKHLDTGDKDQKHSRDVAIKWIQASRFKPDQVSGIEAQEKDFFTQVKTATTSSIAIPTIIAEKIMEVAQETKWHRQLCEVIPIPGIMSMKYPVSTDGVTALDKAQNVVGVEAVPTFDYVEVATYEKKGFVLLPDKLIEVGPAGLVDLIARLGNNAIRKLEFYEMIKGSGTSSWKGLDNYTITEVDCAAGLTYGKLLEAEDGLYDDDLDKAIWVSKYKSTLYNIKDGDGRYMFPNPKLGVLDHDVKKHSAMESDAAYLMNPKRYGIFDQANIRVRITDAGYTLGITDQTLFAFRNDCDGKVLGIDGSVVGIIKLVHIPALI